jgi:hypothetical protein
MSQKIKCLDCKAELELDYESYKGNKFIKIDVSGALLNDDDINKRIKEIEELTNFNEKKNICLNCLDKLIEKTEKKNNLLAYEKDQFTNALENLILELNSTEFRNSY